MWNASPAKAAAYGKASIIGLLLTLVQIFILFFIVSSRTLGADTMHSAGDLATLAGTTYLLFRTWASEQEYLRRYRQWLLFGVLSLALGGLGVAGESLYDLWSGASGTIRAWPLLFAAGLGAAGNWWMHRIVHAATHKNRDALDRNNLDHMAWDGVLSLAVFVAYLSGTPFVDRLIAIVVGLFVLPYLAWKRWKEDGHEHKHKKDNKHSDHENHPH